MVICKSLISTALACRAVSHISRLALPLDSHFSIALSTTTSHNALIFNPCSGVQRGIRGWNLFEACAKTTIYVLSLLWALSALTHHWLLLLWTALASIEIVLAVPLAVGSSELWRYQGSYVLATEEPPPFLLPLYVVKITMAEQAEGVNEVLSTWAGEFLNIFGLT